MSAWLCVSVAALTAALLCALLCVAAVFAAMKHRQKVKLKSSNFQSKFCKMSVRVAYNGQGFTMVG